MKRHRNIALVAGAALLAAACATPSVETAEARPDPRQREEVRNICFQSQVKNWRKHDDHSVIIKVGRKDEYKLDLIGACIPDDAKVAIRIGSDGPGASPCIESGVTPVMGSCVVRKIYKWDARATGSANSVGAAHLALQNSGAR